MTPLEAATHYLKLGLALVSIPKGSKAPTGEAWQEHTVTTLERVKRTWGNGQAPNIGLYHAGSGTAALDVDHEENARLALAAVGISLDSLLGALGPKIQSKNGLKPLYLKPDGAALSRRALYWPHPEGPDPETGKPRTLAIFELRAGSCQDVLPPSIHPDTGKPYEWLDMPQSREELPELPGQLLALWQNWVALKPALERACPWLPPPPKREWKGEGQSVIAAFNERFMVREILERNGYEPAGADRYLSPYSNTGIPGVVILRGDDGS